MNKEFEKWWKETTVYGYTDYYPTKKSVCKAAFLAGQDAMRTEALECCYMYAKDCGCWAEISAEIMRCKK
jgi:hypothetical protein